MDYHFVPTLQVIASLKVALVLWSQPDIEDRIAKFEFSKHFDERSYKLPWKDVRDEVLEKVDECPLPVLLKTLVSRSVNIIAWQLHSYAAHYLKFGALSLREVRWTAQGVIDKRASLGEMMKNEKYSISTRLRVACCHCLDTTIDQLWGGVQNDESSFRLMIYESISTRYWWILGKRPARSRKECISKELLIQSMELLELAISQGFVTSCKYFWPALSEVVSKEKLVELALVSVSNRDSVPVAFAGKQSYTEVFFYLFSEMDEIQKMHVLSTEPVLVLDCLLDWPAQQFFIPTIRAMWHAITQKQCFSLVEQIVNKQLTGFNDYNYSSLFWECVSSMPPIHSSYLIDNCVGTGFDSLLLKLFFMSDSTVILVSPCKERKEDIYFSFSGAHLCVTNISLWVSLCSFIETCMKPGSGLEDRTQLKEVFRFFLSQYRFKDFFLGIDDTLPNTSYGGHGVRIWDGRN